MSTPMITYFSTVARLFHRGIRYSTVIDLGCADGHFFLAMSGYGLASGTVPLNIDANKVYEDSLKEIKEVMGGEYCITAVSDKVGEINFTEAAHPYWSSMRTEDDPYWSRINNLSTAKATVPATTLDKLFEDLALKPPFLVKLDVQGAETAALRGGSRMLANSHIVIVECDMDDFQDINTLLVGAGFYLEDLTGLMRLPDETLGWFYAVYASNQFAHLRPRAIWNAEQNMDVIGQQVDRRKRILEANANYLNKIRARKGTT